jgi:hypothetical protein
MIEALVLAWRALSSIFADAPFSTPLLASLVFSEATVSVAL